MLNNVDVKVVLLDNNFNCYGLMIIEKCKYKSFYVNNLINEIIVDLCGTQDVFFEDFSAYISDMIEKLEKKLNSKIYFYDNILLFNVDNIFNGTENV